MTKPLIVIPARMDSTRLPGKPLADIDGLPLIGHVWGRACASNVGDVVVAAGDAVIVDAVRALGGRAVLTDPALPSGTDRARACADLVDPGGTRPVINVQGDMPDIAPALIRAVADRLAHADAQIVTAVVPVSGPLGPDRVKAVLAADGRALYFTRADAPWGQGDLHQHIGLYGYSRMALARFCDLPPSPLEVRERLEQLRALEAGMRIDCLLTDTIPLSVDTPEDLAHARKALA